jgi:hypothetical protein
MLFKLLLRILFYPSPTLTLTHEEKQLCENLFNEVCNGSNKYIEYNLPIPKYKFLQYLAENKSIVFHGSNNKFINEFEPREQTLYNGTMTKAVFASKDPIWSMFYAVFRKESLVSNIRNGSLVSNRNNKYHFYSLTSKTLTNNPWTNGTVYIIQEKTFENSSKGIIQFDEWTSKQSVIPIARIDVAPTDFYFLNKVACHKADESIIKTWLFYKMRTFFK